MGVSYYEILGIEVTASQGEIKKAYFRLMKSHHPDKHGQQDDPISRLINEAYEILGNPEKRRAYDGKGRGSSSSARTENASDNRRQETRTKPKEERHEKTSGFQSRTKQTRQDQATAKKRPCRECGGRGKVADNRQRKFYISGINLETTCTHCQGSGYEPEQVYLPPGRRYCHKCNGFSKYKKDLSIAVMWERCSHCEGKGLEPIPVDLPTGRKHCSGCNGYGKRKRDLGITKMWERCERCEGNGLEPIPVSLPADRRHCSKCRGFKKYLKSSNSYGFSLGFEMWLHCDECYGTGIEPLPNEQRRRYF